MIDATHIEGVDDAAALIEADKILGESAYSSIELWEGTRMVAIVSRHMGGSGIGKAQAQPTDVTLAGRVGVTCSWHTPTNELQPGISAVGPEPTPEAGDVQISSGKITRLSQVRMADSRSGASGSGGKPPRIA